MNYLSPLDLTAQESFYIGGALHEVTRFLSEITTERKTAIEIGNSMKILIALTSHDKLGNTGRKTGFWLEEMAAPY